MGTTVEDAAPRAKESRCVLFVHGVGEQHRSQTLLWIGSALVEWVLSWSKTFYTGQQPSVGRVELSFNPFDAPGRDTLPFAVLHLPDQDWYMGEAWWAASNQPSDFGTMLAWSFGSLWDILAQMRRATVERIKYLFNPKPNSSTPGVFWRAVDLVNCVAVLILYFLAAIIGYPLLIVLMVLAQIPIEPVQNFIVLKMLRPLLLTTAGEFKLYMDDELQAGNVRRRIADAAQELLTRTGCDDLVVIAHSEGAVVSLGTLTDPIYSPLAKRMKLITLGGGLNKSWLVRPNVDRLFRPLRSNVQWTDIWSSYDPVRRAARPVTAQAAAGQPSVPDDRHLPAQWPARDADQSAGHQRHGDPDRSRRLLHQRRAGPDPAGGRDQRPELHRLGLLAAGPGHRLQPGQRSLPPRLGTQTPRARLSTGVVAGRRRRGLAGRRGRALDAWLADQCRPRGPLSKVPSTAGRAGLLVSALSAAHAWLLALPALFAPLASVPDMLLQLPAALGLAALGGLASWAGYRLGLLLWWSRWDRRDRAAFAAAAAQHSHERLSRMPLTPTRRVVLDVSAAVDLECGAGHHLGLR